MILAAGTRLGPYEVVAALGAGGMGEVYRAKDTRLGRAVAVKVLPAEVASQAGVRERLEREAKSISALTHPNICTLFDVGHQDGTDYLVREFLEGPTLADRLDAGPLPLDEARRIAAQIAAALEAAHEQSIVHRDLKPGNSMRTKGGADWPGASQVNLLDFGLAKLPEPEIGHAPTSSLTTRQTPTARGTIVGTLPYMEPELMAGQAVDACSDLFSYGPVLYEMVTGRRAFNGDTPTAVMASVLGSQPAPPRASGRILVSADGGAEPRWSRGGTELFYRKGRGMYSVPVSTKGGVTVRRPVLLFEGDFSRGSVTPGIPAYDVAPDGQHFIMVTSASDAESPARLDVVLNRVEDLRRLAPR
jgi:serine/threonine protein kinase